MPGTDHNQLTGAIAIHPAAYVQSSDPGAVGAAKFWVDTTTGFVLKKRNSGNSGWDTIAGTGDFTYSGVVTGTAFSASGLTGSTAASRYVGATTSGAPVAGAHNVGDFSIDRSGAIWICTVAGTPGTFVNIGAAAGGVATDTIFDAKGDLAAGTGADTAAKLTVGANDTILMADSAQTTGLKWVASQTPSTQAFADAAAEGTADTYARGDHKHGMPATPSSGSGGGGSGALVPIQFIGPLTAVQASMAFTAPVTGFRNLRIKANLRGDTAATTMNVGMTFNGDTGTNYGQSRMAGNNNSVASALLTGQTSGLVAMAPAANALASSPASVIVDILDYLGTVFKKTWRSEQAFSNSTTTADYAVQSIGGQWASTAAISTITLTPSAGNFAVGSYACLYGEMDTAGVLLTPASNLLSETILTSAQATISVPNIPQGYRDLQVVLVARGDSAATNVNTLIQFNGDTGANYEQSRLAGNASSASSALLTGQTSGLVALTPAANALASSPATSIIDILGYTDTTFKKTWVARQAASDSTTTADYAVQIIGGQWANTAAITSILLSISAGNFAAGSAVRVYGLPAAAGGASVGTGTRLRLSANQSITSATATAITWDTEDNDADNQHYSSAANLTGTVSKTAASATLTGSSTLFTTELSVGQVISVPGTAAEKRVVIAIASNTSLTVNSPFVNTASGQTATRVNSAVVFRQPGFYTLETNVYSAALASGAITLAYYLNSLTTATSGTAIGQSDPTAINASAGYELVAQRQFQQWDFVEVVWTQNSGGAVNVLADERTHFSVNARPTVIVAVPYIRLHDQKAQNTAGGTFTAGADQTRTLTLDVDSGGIATVSSSQVTLPSGTYGYQVVAPGYQCGAHQAFLYNVTDSVEIKRGTSESSGTTSATTTRSVINGRMVISGSKIFEVRHRCTTTSTTNGFGLPANFGAEVYTIAEFWKEG